MRDAVEEEVRKGAPFFIPEMLHMGCVIQDGSKNFEVVIPKRVTVGVRGDRKRLDDIVDNRIGCLRGDLANTNIYRQPKYMCTIP